MPWISLIDALKGGLRPDPGKLWVLGCESIRYDELEQLKRDLNPLAKVLYEELQSEQNKFVDPLAYVFLAESNQANSAT